MPKKKTSRERRGDQTEILRYLQEYGFHPVTPEVILDHMSEFNREMTDEDLDFSLRYMMEKGWIDMQDRRIVGKGTIMEWVKLTAKGSDEIDRRAEGVREIKRAEGV